MATAGARLTAPQRAAGGPTRPRFQFPTLVRRSDGERAIPPGSREERFGEHGVVVARDRHRQGDERRDDFSDMLTDLLWRLSRCCP